MRPLGMLMGLTMIAVTVFSSIFYYAERGQYNDDFKVWERSEGYLCEWRVHSGENPLGRTVHPCWLREPQATQPNQTMWICPYRWPRGDNCWRLWVQVRLHPPPSLTCSRRLTMEEPPAQRETDVELRGPIARERMPRGQGGQEGTPTHATSPRGRG